MYDTLDSATRALAKAMALVGGVVLIALIIMTCISITGRALVAYGLAPIQGDFEMIEIGVGFAIFAFLPWCHYKRAHATVDLFKTLYPKAMNRFVDFCVDVLMLVAAIIIAWRLYLGTMDKMRYSETTFILQFPVWQAYVAGLIGAVCFVLVAAFCVIRSGRIVLGRGAVAHDEL